MNVLLRSLLIRVSIEFTRESGSRAAVLDIYTSKHSTTMNTKVADFIVHSLLAK